MGKLFVVGLGPGNPEAMTYACRAALDQAEILVGYDRYLALAAPLYPDKPMLASGMTREVDRCRQALAQAAQGQTVALVCGGDAGVYGLAGLILELAEDYPPLEIEIIPGVTAALAGAALLGAALTHDFAVISLSDLLTPWALIEKRLAAAGEADFCIALYNPASRGRRDHLARAVRVLLRHKAPATLCGLARQIGRPGQNTEILTLEALAGAEADMFTTVFIGNAATRRIRGRLVTPRGYTLD